MAIAGMDFLTMFLSTQNRPTSSQGIDQCIPCQSERLESPDGDGKLASRPVLNGLHHTYSWMGTQSVEYNQDRYTIVH